ncbi:hypothetical protein ASV53_23745 [Photobacterium sanguinicancri]|uniref:Uncharacterized protein n=1 Tax=Photobacterium sanguinicancri TaxID=875932 RepID=A0ABX4FR65_9GAMM|nr:hypothetical protein ASV53_23745 [Photobacterium sanguinicancri]
MKKTFAVFGNLGFLPVLYKNFPSEVPEDCHLFLDIIQQHSKPRIFWTNIAQSEKVTQYEYKVTHHNKNIDNYENEVDEEIESTQRAHTRRVDIDTYEGRSRSPIMLESDQSAGRQVADAMTEDALRLSKVMKSITLSEAETLLGIDMPSDSCNEEAFAEFINLTNKDINDYLGIEDDEDILIIRHPLVLAFLKMKVNQIDNNIKSLIFDQQDMTTLTSDKVAEIEGLRIVLANMIDKFDEIEHVEADKIITNYDLPPCDPLV